MSQFRSEDPPLTYVICHDFNNRFDQGNVIAAGDLVSMCEKVARLRAEHTKGRYCVRRITGNGLVSLTHDECTVMNATPDVAA